VTIALTTLLAAGCAAPPSRLPLHPELLGTDYDARRTGTAEEALRSRAGNCLFLSILFVAMARELGVDARFQQLEVMPEWDMEGDVLFAARHVNVYGRLHGRSEYVTDFYPYPDEPHPRPPHHAERCPGACTMSAPHRPGGGAALHTGESA
jgi:hypothetical protein